MIQHANEMGANAIVNVRYDATEIMQGVTEVLAYGTAVIVEEILSMQAPLRLPATMSGPTYARLRTMPPTSSYALVPTNRFRRIRTSPGGFRTPPRPAGPQLRHTPRCASAPIRPGALARFAGLLCSPAICSITATTGKPTNFGKPCGKLAAGRARPPRCSKA